MTTRLVDKGWKKELSDALTADSSDVRIISPFIKSSAVKVLLDCKPKKLQVITRFSLADWARGMSDLEALYELIQADAQVRWIDDLHAKLYVFGWTRSIITSANLTKGGLDRNREFGTVFDDRKLIKGCLDYFDRLWKQGNEITLQDLDDSKKRINRYLLRGGKPDDGPDLKDYDADIELEKAAVREVTSTANFAGQAFVKFSGSSETGHRQPASTSTWDVIKSSECDSKLYYPRNKRPRKVRDGAVMFISRFTQNPKDIRVFGRATGMKYVDGLDDATPEEKDESEWRAKYPHYIRVDDAEFIQGTLENGVSLYELMDTLKSDAFARTQKNAKQGKGNVDPKHSYRGQGAVELSDEGYEWLERRLQEAFNTHGRFSTKT